MLLMMISNYQLIHCGNWRLITTAHYGWVTLVCDVICTERDLINRNEGQFQAVIADHNMDLLHGV